MARDGFKALINLENLLKLFYDHSTFKAFMWSEDFSKTFKELLWPKDFLKQLYVRRPFLALRIFIVLI